jgi:predicted GIY-YIG superfamily endonuclease
METLNISIAERTETKIKEYSRKTKNRRLQQEQNKKSRNKIQET